MSNFAPLLVGVDGGATSVRAHVVSVQHGLLVDAGASAAATFADGAAGGAFVAVAIQQQLDEQAAHAVHPTLAEQREAQHRARITAAVVAQALRGVSSTLDKLPAVRVGVCWPGLKTADGRGILVAKNGPRCLDFLTELEAALVAEGVALAAPLPALMSDGLACGLGERLAAAGALRGVQQAWYFGGGTGLAEAVLVDGQVLTVDQLGPGWKRGWELRSRTFQGTFEELVSARGMDARWRTLSKVVDSASHVDEAARRGETAALAVMRQAAAAFAELMVERLLKMHADRGVVLQRIVVGQRVGAWLADEALAPCLADVLRAELATRLSMDAPAAVLRLWLPEGVERPERLIASRLHAAPAFGAASVWLQQEGEEAAARG